MRHQRIWAVLAAAMLLSSCGKGAVVLQQAPENTGTPGVCSGLQVHTSRKWAKSA